MTHPQPGAKPPGSRNRRLSRRLPPKRSTKVVAYTNWLGLGRNVALAVLDVSESGVRLLLKELPHDREFEIDLESDNHKPLKLVAEVVWSFATADGRYVVGARFQKLLPHAALQAFSRI